MSRVRGMWRPALVLAVLVTSFWFGVAVAQDAVVPGGPVGGMAQLWRNFGNFYAPVVAVAPFDDKTGATVTIETNHHEVHEGEMWHSGYTAANVANNGSVDLLLVVSNTIEAHSTWAVFAGGQVQIYLWESPGYTTTGTSVPVVNMNRTVTTTPRSLIYHSPGITTTGTITMVNGRIMPGGTTPQTRIGGGVQQNTEWILAPGKAYLMRVTNTSGAAIGINAVAEWYEEESD